MRELKIEVVGIEEVLRNVGGFWSAISGAGFLLINFYLYRYFFTKSVEVILKAELKQLQEDQKEEDALNESMNHLSHSRELKKEKSEQLRRKEIEELFKERISFQGIYKMYDTIKLHGDLTHDTEERVSRLEAELDEAKFLIRQLQEELKKK